MKTREIKNLVFVYNAYASKFGAKYTFPVVVADTGEDLEVILSATDLNAIGDTEELIRVVSSRMAT
jgi:hypothetical protein